MKALMADLVDRIAEQDASNRDFFIYVEALQAVVTVLVSCLDEDRKKQVRQSISVALADTQPEDFRRMEDREKLKQAIFQLIDRPLNLPMN